MKDYIKNKWGYLPKSVYVLAVLIILLSIGGMFFELWTKENITKIYAGLIVATVITILNVIFDFKNLEFSKLIYDSALDNIFEDRQEKDNYTPLIKKAKHEIKIMGVTSSRFLEDNGRCESKGVLDDLLEKGVSIQILITTSASNLGVGTQSLIKKYKNFPSFEIKRFDQSINIPQSIFVVDQKCALGPIFTDVESKHTPTLLFSDKHSVYAKKFIDYFHFVWDHKDTKNIEL